MRAQMKPSARKVLDIFAASGYGWVRGQTLMLQGGSRFSARLYDLKEFGWAHETRHDPTSAMPMYRLYRAEPEQLRLEIAS